MPFLVGTSHRKRVLGRSFRYPECPVPFDSPVGGENRERSMNRGRDQLIRWKGEENSEDSESRTKCNRSTKERKKIGKVHAVKMLGADLRKTGVENLRSSSNHGESTGPERGGKSRILSQPRYLLSQFIFIV
ncbi:uncharacterized protein LOC105703627 isoform X2 [Orussus abietinus]|uniref:uncharacterized protein LOC105703627 isoform X2 n=1 Tax=Orussus abietinus TaxID=222816 RepID=UPI000625D263|nr:uncharacterized protein LOC105703627 isoform X2 [Orussus abietinus]